MHSVVAEGTQGPLLERLMRPILPPPSSVNHMLPSGPAAMPAGADREVGTVYSVIWPAVVMLATLPLCSSVNQRLPSGPAAMTMGSAAEVGTANSVNVPP